MNIKKYRKKNNMTLEQFAEIIGISAAHLCFIENGKRMPSPKIALKISQAAKGKVKVLELLFPRDCE